MKTILVVVCVWLLGVLSQTDCHKPSVLLGQSLVPASNPCIHYNGRVGVNSDGSVYFDWSGIELRAVFEGTSVAVGLKGANNEYNAFVDGNIVTVVNVTGDNIYTVASGLNKGVHTLLLTKRTEAFFGTQTLTGLYLDDGSWLQSPPSAPKRRIEIIGDSITCGYGDEGKYPCSFSAQTENNLVAYGPLIASHFNAEYYLECWSGKGIVRNYGYPNITSPDPFPIYYNRTLASVDNDPPLWNFNKWHPDAVVINLGTNDCSTNPIPPRNVFVGGFNNFIKVIRGNYGNVPVFLACGPMLTSESPCCGYVKDAVSQNQNTYYIDMLGILEFPNDYGCDYHPAASGHVKMAAKAIPVISSVLDWN